MSRLGERLRSIREAQGISIARAAAETRILQQYLVALEDGDIQRLPGDVYARGFIRNYASYLGIPSDELIELYRQERGHSVPIRVVPTVSTPRVQTLPIPSFLGVFSIVLILVGITYLVLLATNSLTTPIAQNATPTLLPAAGVALADTPIPTATRPPAPSATASRLPTATPAPAGGEVQDLTPTPAQPIILTILVDPGENPGSWLEVRTDERTVFRRVLEPGGKLEYTARRSVWIRAGNASVVSVVVNGREQRLGTTAGEVVTFTWPPE
jgi:cytoskeletal protein RodZ